MDNVKEFAARIRYLAEDVGEPERMGRFNRDRVQELYTLEKMVNNYIKLYRSVL